MSLGVRRTDTGTECFQAGTGAGWTKVLQNLAVATLTSDPVVVSAEKALAPRGAGR